MNGELAQLVALASHGRAALGGAAEALAAVGPDGELFRWVAATEFVAPDGTTASDAAGWVAALRARGIDQLTVVIPAPGAQTSGGLTVSDRMLAGFANAGTSWLLATGGGRAEAWVGGWAVGDREREDRRIWLVRYTGQALDDVPVIEPPTVPEALAVLEGALRRIADFAARAPYLGSWVEVFEAALAADGDAGPQLLPPSSPASARRLAAMASAAWVFGGMGSWNDVGFAPDDPFGAEYGSVSADLYAAVLSATAAAANA